MLPCISIVLPFIPFYLLVPLVSLLHSSCTPCTFFGQFDWLHSPCASSCSLACPLCQLALLMPSLHSLVLPIPFIPHMHKVLQWGHKSGIRNTRGVKWNIRGMQGSTLYPIMVLLNPCPFLVVLAPLLCPLASLVLVCTPVSLLHQQGVQDECMEAPWDVMEVQGDAREHNSNVWGTRGPQGVQRSPLYSPASIYLVHKGHKVCRKSIRKYKEGIRGESGHNGGIQGCKMAQMGYKGIKGWKGHDMIGCHSLPLATTQEE